MGTNTRTSKSTNRLAEADEVRSYVEEKVATLPPPSGNSVSLFEPQTDTLHAPLGKERYVLTDTLYLTADKERCMVVEQKGNATSIHLIGINDPKKDKTFIFTEGRDAPNAKNAAELRKYLITTQALLFPSDLPYADVADKDLKPGPLPTYVIEAYRNLPTYGPPRETPKLTLATQMYNPDRLLASISSKDEKQWFVFEGGKWEAFQGDTKSTIPVDENGIKPFVQDFYRQSGTKKTDGTLVEVLFDKDHLGPDAVEVLSETHLSDLQQSIKTSIRNLPQPSQSFIPRPPRKAASTAQENAEVPQQVDVNAHVDAGKGVVAFAAISAVTLLGTMAMATWAFVAHKKPKEAAEASEEAAATPEKESWVKKLATPAALAVGVGGTALLALRSHNKSTERS